MKTIPVFCALSFGEVSEWSKETVLKTVVGRPTVGSNPTLSANMAVNSMGYVSIESAPNKKPIIVEMMGFFVICLCK